MLHIIGFNHHRCPISLREQVVFSDEVFYDNGKQVKVMLNATDFILLNTCNRSEIIFNGNGVTNIERILSWIASHSHVPIKTLEANMYHHKNLDALNHMIKVCCGLDSMLLGEQQIFGQFKKAVEHGRSLGFVANDLYAICQKVYEACKHIRHATKIHQSTVTLAHAIYKTVKAYYPGQDNLNTLMIGTGETIGLITNQYIKYNLGQTSIAGRTLERAKRIGAKHDLAAMRIQNIPDNINDFDIIITATSSQMPIIGKGLIENTLNKHPEKTFLIFDLAVPRDVETEINQLENCQLLNIDDLQKQMQQGQEHRTLAAKEATKMIAYEANLIYENHIAKGQLNHIINFRQHIQEAQNQAINKALKQLEQGMAPDEVVIESIRRLTNLFLHKPTTQLKQAILDKEEDILKASKYLFETSDIPS